MRRSTVVSITATALLVTAGVAIPTTAANATVACEATQIRINSARGAEAPSDAVGHAHATGNHYLKEIKSGNWYWWADNNGGINGDTADTYYGVKYCGS